MLTHPLFSDIVGVLHFALVLLQDLLKSLS